MDILLASSNEHKKQELESLFSPHKIHLPNEYNINFDCIEDGNTFSENAYIKAKALKKAAGNLNMAILADDSGLIVDALPGLLGVKTNRFGSKDGESILSAEEKNALLLEMLKDRPNRKARFVTSLVMIFPDSTILTSEGVAPGYILEESTGNGGFGYDPVFFNEEANKPSGLFTTEEKNRYSHRGKAARSLLKQMCRHLDK